MAKARDYESEYKAFHGKPEQIKNRASRNAARAKMTEKLGKAAVAGKDVDHKKPLKDGGTNDPKNLRLQSVSKNRGRKT